MNLFKFDFQTAAEADTVAAQTSLKNAGFYTGRLDGLFGPKSQAALREWGACVEFSGDQPRVFAVIEGCTIIEHSDGSLTCDAAPAMVDTDGDGPSHGDPDYQPDTTYHYDGKPLNADLVPFGVVPSGLREMIEAEVLGCQGQVRDTATEKEVDVVWGDVGPRRKFGEISRAAAIALDVPSSPVSGGESRRVLRYTMRPGVPAVVNGTTYPLQAV